MSTKKSRPKPTRLLILFGLLAMAALLWFWPRTESPTVQETAPVETPAPLAEKRSSREAAYQKDIEALRAIAENQLCDAQTRNDAAAKLTALVSAHQTETALDAALRQAGFPTSLTICENGSLTVMLTQNDLTSEQSATILSLCAAHTDIGMENIRLMTAAQ